MFIANCMKNSFSERRSIYPAQFSEKEVTKKEIATLLEAANWAPTHRKTEPWRFKVMQGAKKQALGEFMAEAYVSTAKKPSQIKKQKIVEKVNQSGAVILIGMQRDPKDTVPEWEEIAATAMAVQNLWLQATEMGLGGYWSSPSYSDQMVHFVPFNRGEICLGFFYLGHFEGPPPQRMPNPWQDKVEWYR